MRKMLLAGVVGAALAVPAPAFAIHDGTGMPGAVCSNPDSRAVGNNPNPGTPNTAFSNEILEEHNPMVGNPPPCHFND
jgi:hypothetical protein